MIASQPRRLHASTDDNGLARDIVGITADKESCNACDFMRFAEPSQRNALQCRLRGRFIFPKQFAELRLDDTGRDCVDANTSRGPLMREISSYSEQSCFAAAE